MVQVVKSIEKKGRKRMVTESTKMTQAPIQCLPKIMKIGYVSSLRIEKKRQEKNGHRIHKNDSTNRPTINLHKDGALLFHPICLIQPHYIVKYCASQFLVTFIAIALKVTDLFDNIFVNFHLHFIHNVCKNRSWRLLHTIRLSICLQQPMVKFGQAACVQPSIF